MANFLGNFTEEEKAVINVIDRNTWGVEVDSYSLTDIYGKLENGNIAGVTLLLTVNNGSHTLFFQRPTLYVHGS